MPLPKAPKKPADKLAYLPSTASEAAHTPTPFLSKDSTDSINNSAAISNINQALPPSNQLEKALAKTTKAVPKQSKSKKISRSTDQKIYVLDTNVLLHDPSSLFRFDENNIFLPMMVLEELDNHKKGTTEVSRHARQITRTLDRLIKQTDGDITTGLPLRATEDADFSGYLYFQTDIANSSVPKGLAVGVPDHLILGEVERLAKAKAPQQVILVSKDINIRLKATVLGLNAQDYLNDNITQDSDNLHTGWIDTRTWNKAQQAQLTVVEQWQENGITHLKLTGNACSSLIINSFVLLSDTIDADGIFELGARVIDTTGKYVILKAVRDFTLAKNAVWGVQARNIEQNSALNLLTNPEVDCVSLLGQAGTGKTLLALAAGLAQVLDKRIYSDIILTRATVSVGDDIGFLPGTEEEKMAPWMGAVEDNLEVLLGSAKSSTGSIGGIWGQQASIELVRSRIKIKSMAFMRGRTFQNKFVIIDEAQNLTPKQMKTLITRAGPGTKFVCLGNLAQIDTPYLTEHSSGLGYVIDRFKGWPHGGHVTLARGERSRLAEFATEVL
jgi:PhoH-like ATPase